MDGNVALGGIISTGLDANLGANLLDTGIRGYSGIGAFSLLRDELNTFSRGRDGYLHSFEADKLNQLSTGTTPVTVATDPVGFVADTRLGMALGPDLISAAGATNTFDGTGNITGWSTFGGGVNNNGVDYADITTGGASNIAITRVITTTPGKTYRITFDRIAGATASSIYLDGVSIGIAFSATAGSYTAVFVATAASHGIYVVSAGASLRVRVDNIFVKLLEGNHCIQATAGARPTWTNRVNLLLHSNIFSNADYTKVDTTITSENNLSPAGGLDATLLTQGSAGTGAIYQSITSVAGVNYTFSKSFKYGNTPWVLMEIGNGAYTSVARQWVNIQTGVLGSSAVVGVATIQGATITAEPNGYYRVTLSANTVGAFTALVSWSSSVDADLSVIRVTGATRYIYGGQTEYGTSATRYQRVTTATDFDTAGFPYYLSFTGSPMSLTSATGGAGSNGFCWCGVVQPTGGAGTVRVLWDDRGTNTGYVIYLSNANKLVFQAGNGAAYTTLTSTATVDVGTAYLLTVRDNGTNLSIQIGSAAAETIARPVVAAGTAGLTIGKTNGAATFYLIANFYPNVYWKDTGGTDAEVTDAQAWARAKGGM